MAPHGYGAAVKNTSLVDHGFMDARSKLLDVAAFLDRVERHGQEGDYRVSALVEALPHLMAGPGRVSRILTALSDPTTSPVDSAAGQAAHGAWRGPSDL